MKSPRVVLWNTVIILTVATAPAFAADPVQAPLRPLRNSFLTNGVSTRRAFADVVAEANLWTARILADGKEVGFGVIVREDGFILTKGDGLAGRLECELPGAKILPARFVGYHPGTDLALLSVDAAGLAVVRWQEGDDPEVGRWVVTPDAQGPPRSVGVVSVPRRSVPEVRIPGKLGVRLDAPDQPAKIVEVIAESAAAAAGLQAGDVITQVNHIAIPSAGRLIAQIEKHRPNELVRLVVIRDGQERIFEARLTYPFGDLLSRIDQQNEMGGSLSLRRTGFDVVLQHDSVLKPEECGGPLVDMTGAAVGVNIARAGRTETYALPDDLVRPVVEELLVGKYPPPDAGLAGAPQESSSSPTSTSVGE